MLCNLISSLNEKFQQRFQKVARASHRKPASLLPEKTNSLNTSTPANLSNPSNKLSELQTKLKSDRDMYQLRELG